MSPNAIALEPKPPNSAMPWPGSPPPDDSEPGSDDDDDVCIPGSPAVNEPLPPGLGADELAPSSPNVDELKTPASPAAPQASESTTKQNFLVGMGAFESFFPVLLSRPAREYVESEEDDEMARYQWETICAALSLPCPTESVQPI